MKEKRQALEHQLDQQTKNFIDYIKNKSAYGKTFKIEDVLSQYKENLELLSQSNSDINANVIRISLEIKASSLKEQLFIFKNSAISQIEKISDLRENILSIYRDQLELLSQNNHKIKEEIKQNSIKKAIALKTYQLDRQLFDVVNPLTNIDPQESAEIILALLTKIRSLVSFVNEEDGNTLLHLAALDNSPVLAEIILQLNKNPNYPNVQNKKGRSALSSAAFYDYPEVTIFLQQKIESALLESQASEIVTSYINIDGYKSILYKIQGSGLPRVYLAAGSLAVFQDNKETMMEALSYINLVPELRGICDSKFIILNFDYYPKISSCLNLVEASIITINIDGTKELAQNHDEKIANELLMLLTFELGNIFCNAKLMRVLIRDFAETPEVGGVLAELIEYVYNPYRNIVKTSSILRDKIPAQLVQEKNFVDLCNIMFNNGHTKSYIAGSSELISRKEEQISEEGKTYLITNRIEASNMILNLVKNIWNTTDKISYIGKNKIMDFVKNYANTMDSLLTKDSFVDTSWCDLQEEIKMNIEKFANNEQEVSALGEE